MTAIYVVTGVGMAVVIVLLLFAFIAPHAPP